MTARTVPERQLDAAVSIIEVCVVAVEGLEARNKDVDLTRPLADLRDTLQHASELIDQSIIGTEKAGV